LTPRDFSLFVAVTNLLANNNSSKILDVGGTVGNHIINLEYMGVKADNYAILESPTICDELSKVSKRSYYSDISDVNFVPDLIYISGTLQYINKYEFFLDEVKLLNPKIIAINRTPFWEKETTVTSQINKAKRLTYACRIFNLDEILNNFSNSRYDCIPVPYQYDEPYVTTHGFLKYSSYLFIRKEK
jgi:putative methyltransferase (TIGR04325 family)